MSPFHNPLLVSVGLGDESAAFEQALSLQHRGAIELQVFVAGQSLPATLGHHREQYEAELESRTKALILRHATALALDPAQMQDQHGVGMRQGSSCARSAARDARCP